MHFITLVDMLVMDDLFVEGGADECFGCSRQVVRAT